MTLILVVPLPFLQCCSIFVSIVLRVAFVLSLLYPNLYLGPCWVWRLLARGDAVHGRPNCLDTCRASASMNAVSGERFTPAAAADVATPTVRICVRRLWTSTPRIHKIIHCLTVHVRTCRLSHSEGVHRVPLNLHASRPQMGREVDGHLRWRQRQAPFSPPSRTTGNRNADRSASAHCR